MSALAAVCAAIAAWLAVPNDGQRARVPSRQSILSRAQRAAGRDAVLVVAVFAAMGPMLAVVAAIVLRVVVLKVTRAPEPDDSLCIDDVLVASDFLSVCAGAGLTTLESIRRLQAADAGAASHWAAGVVARHSAGIPFATALVATGHASAADMCRVLRRAHATGAPIADRLRRQSAALRRARRDETLRRVRGLSVRAVAPLGACFLPAFVLLAVVPLAASFATGLAV